MQDYTYLTGISKVAKSMARAAAAQRTAARLQAARSGTATKALQRGISANPNITVSAGGTGKYSFGSDTDISVYINNLPPVVRNRVLQRVLGKLGAGYDATLSGIAGFGRGIGDGTITGINAIGRGARAFGRGAREFGRGVRMGVNAYGKGMRDLGNAIAQSSVNIGRNVANGATRMGRNMRDNTMAGIRDAQDFYRNHRQAFRDTGLILGSAASGYGINQLDED